MHGKQPDGHRRTVSISDTVEEVHIAHGNTPPVVTHAKTTHRNQKVSAPAPPPVLLALTHSLFRSMKRCWLRFLQTRAFSPAKFLAC